MELYPYPPNLDLRKQAQEVPGSKKPGYSGMYRILLSFRRFIDKHWFRNIAVWKNGGSLVGKTIPETV
jgi:hypothetical protein